MRPKPRAGRGGPEEPSLRVGSWGIFVDCVVFEVVKF